MDPIEELSIVNLMKKQTDLIERQNKAIIKARIDAKFAVFMAIISFVMMVLQFLGGK